MNFSFQYGKALSMAFCSHLLISNDFLLGNGKTQTNFISGTRQILGCLINTLSKYIFMQRLTIILGYPLLRKICFKLQM